MSYFSSFVSTIHSAWSGDASDPLESDDGQQLIAPTQLNILYHRQEQFELDNAATRSITLANYTSSEWTFFVMKVVGQCYFSISALDTDGVTVITSKIPAYGTALLPGIAIFSSYNVSSVSVVSEADDTTVQLYAAISCADDDARLV